MRKPALLLLFLTFLLQTAHSQHANWGLIANPGFEGDAIKSTLLFTGNWRNEVQFYDYNPSSNTGLYSMHPSDAQHLGWSESQANRDYAITTLVEAGVNIINFSYWGLPGTDNWAYWAPMQTSTGSHDQLFDAALDKDVLVAPFIESFAATDNDDGFSFINDFPGTVADPAPILVSLVEDLIDRYLLNPSKAQWPDKWAKLYDRNGNERYMISIIHVASNKPDITDLEFANGFDLVCDLILENTGINVGFSLDILPPDSYAPGLFKATASNTGTYLSQQESVLAIQCFIPEIWQGISQEHLLMEWKAVYARGWINTGIPWIHDVSSGYDAHIIFPTSPVYGNNDKWKFLQDSLIQELETNSFAFHAWNGYTEGFAGVPTLQYGDTTYKWVCHLFGGNCWEEPEPEALVSTEGNHSSLKLFPNPARDFIHIELAENYVLRAVQVLSADGRVVQLEHYKVGTQSAQLILNREVLGSGYYLIRIETHKGRLTRGITILPE